jgi:orotidine-5'-phosphate decarboxylase
MTTQAKSRVILALDFPALDLAKDVARRVAPHLAAVKIGNQLFTSEGPSAVAAMREMGLQVFLDLKYHDIPNTVGQAVASASRLGVWMLNLHASGGAEMMRAAAAVAGRPIILGVTVLTSMDEAILQATLGTTRTLRGQVTHLAREAQAAGLDGVIASPQEIREIRGACGPRFLIVTPGVRPADAAHGDQRRVLTPGEAVRAGADYVVIGRPILAAPDPVEAAKKIVEECGRATAD